jgi:hypothetical protein
VQYQIYVADFINNGEYGEWRFYDSAYYDDSGQALSVTPISRKVDRCNRYGCSVAEHIGVNISHKYLTVRQSSGIRFQVSGQGGKEAFFIPPAYIRAFLTAIPGQTVASTTSSPAPAPSPHPLVNTKVSTEAELDAEYEAARQKDTLEAY